MENQSHYGGHSAGPIAAIVLIAIALIVIGWLDVGLIDTLMHA